MSGIFDENNMRQVLGKHIPEGETLLAGIHGVGLKTEIRQVFGKCTLFEDKLVPDENGAALAVSKSKYSNYDAYIGITEHYLILSECEACKYLYEVNEAPDLERPAAGELGACVPLEDIGACFPLAEIQKCEFKKIWMGAVNCMITMKNGSFLKLMLPKRGGLGGGMPHHAQYREAIMACLGSLNGGC